MPRSLKIKIDGSGSCTPAAPAVAGGTLADNLNGAPSIANFAAIGVPVFTWDNRRNEAIVIDPDGEQYTLAEWCQDHQINAAGQAEILDNITKEEGTCSACRATFHPSVCLHAESSPFPLIIKNRKLILHVSRRWDNWKEARPDPSKPWLVQHGIDYGTLMGNNIVAVYLTRPASTGSEGSSAYGYKATYTTVPAAASPYRPWPQDSDRGLWPWTQGHATTTRNFAIPLVDPAEDSPSAQTLGPKEEVLKIVYHADGATIDSGAAEPLQASAGHSFQPEVALQNSLHRIGFWFLTGLIPPPASGYGYPHQWDGSMWTGDTGPWRMGVYSQTINGRTRRAFIKIGQQSGTIEAVKTALASPTSDPLVIGHASPFSDGNLWQQSDTGTNALIPYADGTYKTALLPADAALQLPYNLHFAEACWADTCTVSVRIFTGSGNTAPTRVDAMPSVTISLANTPVTDGATTSTSGASIAWQNGHPVLVLQLASHLNTYYDSALRAEVYALDQDETVQVQINLVRGAASGIFPISAIGEDTPTDFDTFASYNSYSMDLDIDPEVG